jgi:hypothetical protein
LPSQVPSRPQVASPDAAHWPALCGALPAGTNVQVPGDPGTLHPMHVPVQAVLQQTPSTQKPLWQSPSQPHVSPLWALAAPLAAVHVVGLSLPPSVLGFLPPDPPHAAAPIAITMATAIDVDG